MWNTIAHFATLSAADLMREHLPARPRTDRASEDAVRLDAAVAWLLRSIAACGGNGSSKGYRVLKGWMPAYPETTGYIIPTLLDLADTKARTDLRPIAKQLGRWLAGIQKAGGGFVGRELGTLDQPIVFNTGQILHGLNALVYRAGMDELRPSAVRAGDFLIASMDDSGCFVRNVSNGIIHAYNVRTAWALLPLSRITGQARFADAALANADWTLRQQTENGFFLNNQFKPGGNANSHGLAYVLQGVMEFYRLTGEQRFLAAVERSCNRIVEIYTSRRRLSAELGESWEELSSHVCLTGNAQLAIVLFDLFRAAGDRRHLDAALDLLDEVAAAQSTAPLNRPYCGAIKGSRPVYGRYAPLQYPNWATKFFVDALLAKERALRGEAYRAPVELSAG